MTKYVIEDWTKLRREIDGEFFILSDGEVSTGHDVPPEQAVFSSFVL